VTESKGRFQKASKEDTGIVYVPAKMVSDNQFPFREGARVLIRIQDERLIIEKG